MKPYKILFLFSLIVLLFPACDKLPANGDLDGMWQLMTIEKNGEEAEEVKSKKVYYSFQLGLVQLNSYELIDRNGFYAHFSHSDGTLLIYGISFPSKNESASDNNIELTEADLPRLAPLGIYSLNPRFKVLKLNSKEMILQSEHAKLTFRKF